MNLNFDILTQESSKNVGILGLSSDSNIFHDAQSVRKIVDSGAKLSSASNAVFIRKYSSDLKPPIEPMTVEQEQTIRGYVWRAGENHEWKIDRIIEECRHSIEQRAYYLQLDKQEREDYANRLIVEEECVIGKWLEKVGEFRPEAIALVINACNAELNERAYYLAWAKEFYKQQ